MKAYDNDFRDYYKLFAIAYTWVGWLESIIRRVGYSILLALKRISVAHKRRFFYNNGRFLIEMPVFLYTTQMAR